MKAIIRKVLYAAVPIGLVIIGVVAFMAAVGPKGVQNPFVSEDPPGKTESSPWFVRSPKKGLTLTIENALEDKYDPFFDEYIKEWSKSNALILTTRKVSRDVKCSFTQARVKVCNGEYGMTDWRGIATNVLRNGFTVWSTIKLNDSFLNDESDTQRRYTMCHELGHGFGLPHTDENYFNKNRGDCLDYTLNVGGNLDPGQFNFDLLVQLYGSTLSVQDGTSSTTNMRGSGASSSALVESASSLQEAKREKHGDDRDLGGLRRAEQDQADMISDEIMAKYQSVVAKFEAMECTPTSPCRAELGEGWVVETHQLLVLPR